jgi:hypothetical protein
MVPGVNPGGNKAGVPPRAFASAARGYRLLEEALGDVIFSAILRDEPEDHLGDRDSTRIVQGAPALEHFFRRGHGPAVVPEIVGEYRQSGGELGDGIERRILVHRGQGALDPVASLVQVASEPEEPEEPGQTQETLALAVALGLAPGQRLADIRDLDRELPESLQLTFAVEPGTMLGGVGETPAGVPIVGLPFLAGFGEPLQTVFADRFEHREAVLPLVLDLPDEALVDQRRDPVQDRRKAESGWIRFPLLRLPLARPLQV